MTRYVDVSHAEWIDAPVATVRAQFADLDHQIRRNVHQSLRLRMLEQRPRGARFVQEMRLLGIRQRNVFERTIEPDGTIEDVSVEGFNRGYRNEEARFPTCDGTTRQMEAELRARGLRVAQGLSARHD